MNGEEKVMNPLVSKSQSGKLLGGVSPPRAEMQPDRYQFLTTNQSGFDEVLINGKRMFSMSIGSSLLGPTLEKRGGYALKPAQGKGAGVKLS